MPVLTQASLTSCCLIWVEKMTEFCTKNRRKKEGGKKGVLFSLHCQPPSPSTPPLGLGGPCLGNRPLLYLKPTDVFGGDSVSELQAASPEVPVPRALLPALPACCPGAPDSAESRSGRAAVLELPLAGRRPEPGSNDWVGGRRLGVWSAFGTRVSLDSRRCRLHFPAADLKTPPICGRR